MLKYNIMNRSDLVTCSSLQRNEYTDSVLSVFQFNKILSKTQCSIFLWNRARGSVVGCGTMLQAGRSRVRFPMRSLRFFIWPHSSSPTTAPGSTQPLTKMSTRNLPGDKGRPVRMAENLTAIFEPDFLENVGALTSHNPLDLQGLLQG
jgi:hypothetical protein